MQTDDAKALFLSWKQFAETQPNDPASVCLHNLINRQDEASTAIDFLLTGKTPENTDKAIRQCASVIASLGTSGNQEIANAKKGIERGLLAVVQKARALSEALRTLEASASGHESVAVWPDLQHWQGFADRLEALAQDHEDSFPIVVGHAFAFMASDTRPGGIAGLVRVLDELLGDETHSWETWRLPSKHMATLMSCLMGTQSDVPTEGSIKSARGHA